MDPEATLAPLPLGGWGGGCLPCPTLLGRSPQVADVSALRQLKALQTLHLDSTLVNEASLRTLSSHQTLSTLTLSGVQSVDGNRALELVSGRTRMEQHWG